MDKISSRILKNSLPFTLATVTRIIIINTSFITNAFKYLSKNNILTVNQNGRKQFSN